MKALLQLVLTGLKKLFPSQKWAVVIALVIGFILSEWDQVIALIDALLGVSK